MASYTNTSAARKVTQSGLDSLGRQKTNLDKKALNDLTQLTSRYKSEDAIAKTQYDEQVAANEGSRSKNVTGALTAAAQGGRGLFSSLSSLNALNGTGSLLARRAVAQSANKDIGGANDSFATNAKNLNNAWAVTEQDQRNRMGEANTDYQNALLKNAGSIASQRQSLIRDMASFWTQAGNTVEAAKWLAKIPGENPAIEAAAMAKTPTFQARDAKFSPQALNKYLAGGRDMSVKTQGSSDGMILNSPLFASTRKREESV